MTEPKSKQDKSESYVKTFRHGAIAANVFRHESLSGFEYLDFSLSRSWKNNESNREGYSSSFFERNADDLHAAIRDAVAFIRAQMDESGQPESAGDSTQLAEEAPAAGELV